MKKIIFIFLLVITCIGCTRRTPYVESQNAINGVYRIEPTLEYRIENIEGHQYIIFKGVYCVSAIHSESCPCKKKK